MTVHLDSIASFAIKKTIQRLLSCTISLPCLCRIWEKKCVEIVLTVTVILEIQEWKRVLKAHAVVKGHGEL